MNKKAVFKFAMPSRLLPLLLTATLLTAVLPTIAVYRALIQPAYEWGLLIFSGTGTSPGYFGLLASALLAWATFLAGARRKWPLFRILLPLWWGLVSVTFFYGVLTEGRSVVFRGDAMGFSFNLAVIGPTLSTLLFLAALRFTLRPPADLPPRVTSIQSRASLVGSAVLVPAIIILFWLGDGVRHHPTDVVAIVLVVLQGLLFASGIEAPSKASAA